MARDLLKTFIYGKPNHFTRDSAFVGTECTLIADHDSHALIHELDQERISNLLVGRTSVDSVFGISSRISDF